MKGHGGVGVNEVAALGPHFGDHGLGGGVVAAAGGKMALQLLLDRFAHLIPAGLGQGLHIAPHLLVVVLGKLEEHPLQIGGDEDIHGGGHGVVERAVPVVHAGLQKVREDVVAVGGADQLVDGHAHLPGVVGRKNVAEVARGHTDVDRFPLLHLALPQQIAVGRDVIHHLGKDTAPVDGVGRGEEIAALGQRFPQALVGEQPFHAGLGIVEVAHHGADPNVAALLGAHLELLDVGDAVLRIEHQDAGLVHIPEALQGGLSGIAGGSHQDADRLFFLVLYQRGGQEVGQHLQGHILKGAGRTVPQLQAVGAVVHCTDGGNFLCVELVRPIGVVGVAGQLGGGEVLQERVHDEDRPLLIGHVGHGSQAVWGQLGQHLRRQKAAVGGQALGDGLGGRAAPPLVSRTYVLHTSLTTLIKLE